MPERLTIYACPGCGSLDVERSRCESLPDHDLRRVAIRVFREDDVRPLWDFVRSETEILPTAAYVPAEDLIAAFPAPVEWRSVAVPGEENER